MESEQGEMVVVRRQAVIASVLRLKASRSIGRGADDHDVISLFERLASRTQFKQNRCIGETRVVTDL